MKKFAALTISLLAALTSIGGTVAYAADGGTIYPEDEEFIKTLELTSLTDYAVGDDFYAFADGKSVKVYSDGNYKEYAFENSVISVDIKEGVIYCGCSNEKAYTIPDQKDCEYAFPETKTELLFNGFYYFIDENGINVFDKKNNITFDGEYSNIKNFGEKVYAVKENKLYCFTGVECAEVVLEYADYSATREITIGQARTALKSYSEAKFVEIAAGASMTAVDLEQVDGQYFIPVSTTKAESNITALLLCYSGNAAIVTVKDTAYVLLKNKVTETQLNCSTEIPFENAQMLGGRIYASPYVVSGTVSSSEATNIKVKVTDRLENADILGSVFYEVEYTVDGKTEKGYVAEGFLSKLIIEDDKDPTEVKDPEYSDSNDTKTILIIFAVVLLVLAAVGYVSYVSSKSKKKAKNKNKDKDEK